MGKDARGPRGQPRQDLVPAATALPVTKGAGDAPSVAHTSPPAGRAIEPDSREIVAAGESGPGRQARPGCAFVRGKRTSEPTLSLERWFWSGCYPYSDQVDRGELAAHLAHEVARL